MKIRMDKVLENLSIKIQDSVNKKQSPDETIQFINQYIHTIEEVRSKI